MRRATVAITSSRTSDDVMAALTSQASAYSSLRDDGPPLIGSSAPPAVTGREPGCVPTAPRLPARAWYRQPRSAA